MKIRSLTIAAALSAALIGNVAAASTDAELRALCQKVVSSETAGAHVLSLKEAYRILKEAGYKVKELGDDNFKISYQGRNFVMFRFDDGDFQLYYGISGVKVDYAAINEWNRTKRLSRAYIDRVGDPVLEADLLGDAGLTEKQLISFTKTFLDVSVPAYRSFVLEKGN